jgi:tetratricopeptide (TPR) repeat protein
VIRSWFSSKLQVCPPLAGVCAVLLLCLPPAAAGEDPPAARPPETPPAAEPEKVQELVRRGNTLRQAGRLTDALLAYRSALSLDPRRYEIHVLIADTARRLGRNQEAAAEYAIATDLAPGRSEGYTGRSLIRRAEFDFAGAAAILEPALERTEGEERAEILVSLAETRRREGRPAEAEALFRRALDTDADAVVAHNGLARLAEERGDLDTALAELDRYLASKPEDGAAVLRKEELGELRTSVRVLRAAIESGGVEAASGAALRGELGRLLAIAGDGPGAVQAFRGALHLEPRSLDHQRRLALALMQAGDERAARAEFERLLRRDPRDGTALYHAADQARRSGDRKAEEAAWIDLVRNRPDDLLGLRAYAAFVKRGDEETLARALELSDPEARGRRGALPPAARLRLRALLWSQRGSWAEAEEATYRALLIDPTDPWTLEVTSEILGRRPALLAALAKRAAEALAAERPPEVVPPLEPLLLLGRCLALSGQGEQALAQARRAADDHPQSAIARSFLAEMLQAAGRGREAMAELESALGLDPSRPAAHVDLTLTLLRAGRAKEAEAAARRGLQRLPGSAPLLSLLGAALVERGDPEAGAREFAAALVADPADNFHLARGQYPSALAALGRSLEARRALLGGMPEIPDLVYLEAWAFARDTFRDRAYHGQDWQAWRDRFVGRLRTRQEAHRAIAEMLSSLGDVYTRLRDPEETAAVLLTRHGGPPRVDALGRNLPHAPTVVARELPGGLGYIQIANLADPNAVAEVRQALLMLGEKEGIVLDLRGNPGGLARSADAVADMLIGPGHETGVDVGPDGATRRITGGEGALTEAPITVLVDGQTGSAAERLAAGLEATGRGTLLGDTTRGKGVFQNARVLPGGCTVLVTAGEALGPDGRPIQGLGLRPAPKDREAAPEGHQP